MWHWERMPCARCSITWIAGARTAGSLKKAEMRARTTSGGSHLPDLFHTVPPDSRETATRKRVPALRLSRKLLGTHRLCASQVPLDVFASEQGTPASFVLSGRTTLPELLIGLVYPLYFLCGGIFWPTFPVTCSAFFEIAYLSLRVITNTFKPLHERVFPTVQR